jgi:outer membrane cobalamin receptor
MLLMEQPGLAQDSEEVERIRVTGHYENAVGTSDAASQGNITARLIEARPLLRPGEVLEYVPGVIVTQHSGDGKANQYFLRGFNLDHGTDFSTTVAHMPANMSTHAHGQGYSDLNFVIPELISRLSYKKGPYLADQGDFSSAGSADIHYQTRMNHGVASVGLGSRGYRRALAANSFHAGAGHLLYGLELFHNDGPWQAAEHFNKVNGVLRYSQGTNADGYTVTGMAYQGRWNATDQVPRRAVDSGLISRFGTIDPTDGGRSERYSLSFDRHKALENGEFHMDAYAIKYRLKLFSNFTYFANDLVNGDQFEQSDGRTIIGVNPSWTLTGKWGDRQYINAFGLNLRRDHIGSVGLYNTAARERLSTVRADKVRQTGLGAWFQNTLQWSETFRTVAGARADSYAATVDSDLAANSGSTNARITSPKVNVIFGPFARTEYFFNYGHGFHSNDARGTTITLDPGTLAPAEKVPALVKTKGAEFGVRTDIVSGLQSSLSLWRLALASELVFTGDAGTTEASRASLRRGIEWSNRYIPRPWLIVDLDLSASRAEFTDADPAGNAIPGAIDKVASFGVTLNDLGRWSLTGHLRYFGPRPLIEDNSRRSQSSINFALRAAYRVDSRMKLHLDVHNLFNRRASDIDYFYASRLRGEPAPVDDVHFHPAEPRSLRVALVASF